MTRNNNFTLVIIVIGLVLSLSAFGQAKLPASSIKTIYITPTSHYDFGFVEAPDQVRERAARHIDEVIRVAESDPEFRWTIESVWQVDEWLKRQKKATSVLPKDKEKIARLMNLIKSGRINLSTAWGSMHTDFMGEEELNRMCYDYATLNRSYGVTSQLAMMDDVPGHPTSIPSVLAGSGTKYLVTGANIFIGVATSLAPGKVPFYWESPDGSKVLTWISQGTRGGYVEGMTDFYLDPYSLDPYTDKTPFDMFNPALAGKKKDIEIMEIGITELLNRYNTAGYKYDAVMAMYAHDFVEPTNVLNLERAVTLWNKKHDEVKLRIATPTEFLKYIEGKYAAQIPTFRGEWSGLWSEAKTQSPRVSALARYAHDQTPSAETLWSAIAMTRQIPAPVGNFADLYDLMMTYDEHSGAGNNGWPQLNSRGPLEDQNRQYVRFISSARDEVDSLMEKGVRVIAQTGRYDQSVPVPANKRSLVVYNGLSWRRSDVVRVAAPEANEKITAIRDATGSPVNFDIDGEGNAVFIATNIPSFGYSSFEVTTAAGKASTTLVPTNSMSAKNGRYSIKLKSDGTIQSIRDLRENREIVSNRGERPFNDLLRVEGSDASNVVYPIAPKISVLKGSQMTQVTVRRERSVFPITTVTIYDYLDRVAIHNELDPAYLNFVGGNNNWNDSYYFAFPFNVAKDGLKILRGGQKWFDTLPDDYLPDARHDAVTTQHLLGITDGKSTAMIAHRQAFHWVFPGFVSTRMRPQGAPAELPAMFTGKFPLPEATIYSRALRSSNQADTHDQGIVHMDTVEPGLDGNYIYDYAVAAAGIFDPVVGWRMGADFDLPLRAEYTQVAPVRPSVGFFSVDQPNVQIVDVKPFSDTVIRGEVSAAPLNPQPNKFFVVRLQEFAGRGANVSVSMPVKLKSASIVNLTENEVLGSVADISPLTVSIKPYQTLTIKFEIE
ncbi:MAG: glycosyl hydrolase-related protein [Pyrinomonadaceae bacterium]